MGYKIVNEKPKVLCLFTAGPKEPSFTLEYIISIAEKEFPNISLSKLVITPTENTRIVYIMQAK